MLYKGAAWVLIAAALVAVSQGQYLRRTPYAACPTNVRYSCNSCGLALDDLNLLLQLAEAVEEPESQSSLSDEIILKLVNALVYTSTQNSGCGNSGGIGLGSNGIGMGWHGNACGSGLGLGGGLGGDLSLPGIIGAAGGLGGGLGLDLPILDTIL